MKNRKARLLTEYTSRYNGHVFTRVSKQALSGNGSREKGLTIVQNLNGIKSKLPYPLTR